MNAVPVAETLAPVLIAPPRKHRPVKFIGMDLETSGSDPERHVILQVGAVEDGHRFEGVTTIPFMSYVGHTMWDGTEEASRIHGISAETTLAAPDVAIVDAMLLSWLQQVNPYGFVVPIGFNVGSFDMQFVRRALPRSYKKMGYRSVDLNAIIFTLAKMGLGTFDTIKTAAKEYGAPAVGKPHDALYDAQEAVAAWHWLQMLAAGVIEVPQ